MSKQDLHLTDMKQQPERGSIYLILQTLSDTGPLSFEADELESLLVDIANMRELDPDKYDWGEMTDYLQP